MTWIVFQGAAIGANAEAGSAEAGSRHRTGNVAFGSMWEEGGTREDSMWEEAGHGSGMARVTSLMGEEVRPKSQTSTLHAKP